MKLEINTNGAWRTVMRGLTESLHPQHLAAAKRAAAALCIVDSAISRKPHKWRLVSEETDCVIEHCDNQGWRKATGVEWA